VASHDYRALTVMGIRRWQGELLLHLVREDAESALCGIPRGALGQAHGHADTLCPMCVDWLPRRAAFSAAYGRRDPLLAG